MVSSGCKDGPDIRNRSQEIRLDVATVGGGIFLRFMGHAQRCWLEGGSGKPPIMVSRSMKCLIGRFLARQVTMTEQNGYFPEDRSNDQGRDHVERNGEER